MSTKDTKDELLKELSSIKHFLESEPDPLADGEAAIPTLKNAVAVPDSARSRAKARQEALQPPLLSSREQVDALEVEVFGPSSSDGSPSESPAPAPQGGNTPGVLPGQHSLFEGTAEQAQQVTGSEASSARALASHMLKKPLGENPFLPEHIRNRLKGATVAKPQTPPAAEPQVSQADPREALVDELVDEFLPKIEQQLRLRLAELLKNNP